MSYRVLVLAFVSGLSFLFVNICAMQKGKGTSSKKPVINTMQEHDYVAGIAMHVFSKSLYLPHVHVIVKKSKGSSIISMQKRDYIAGAARGHQGNEFGQNLTH